MQLQHVCLPIPGYAIPRQDCEQLAANGLLRGGIAVNPHLHTADEWRTLLGRLEVGKECGVQRRSTVFLSEFLSPATVRLTFWRRTEVLHLTSLESRHVCCAPLRIRISLQKNSTIDSRPQNHPDSCPHVRCTVREETPLGGEV